MKRIQDEFSGLSVTRQRKHQLRNLEAYKAHKQAWEQTEAGKASKQRRNQRYAAKLRDSQPVNKSVDT